MSDCVFCDFAATPTVSETAMPLAGVPVTVASSASQPSPKTLSEDRLTPDMFAMPPELPESAAKTDWQASWGSAICEVRRAFSPATR